MVQYGILSVVVVMKINRKIIVPPIRGGLWWRVPGGTSADRYRDVQRCIRMYLDTDGFLVNGLSGRRQVNISA